jgi:putative oxidoreductase
MAIVSILGRILLCAIFLLSAVGNKIPKFDQVAGFMEAKGVPLPRYALMAAIAFLIVGSLSVIAGFRARFGAFLLALFLIPTTYYFHNPAAHPAESPEAQAEMIQLMKNAALFGAMLFIIANGSGAGSLDKGCCVREDEIPVKK